MNDKEFAEIMKNKSLDDIMEDYDDQQNEWETLLVKDENGVKRFRHKNGKDFFCEQYKPDGTEYVVNEKIAEALSGKTIEQQMEHYYVTESRRLYSTAYGEITDDDLKKHSVKLCDYKGIQKLLLKGNILIGAKINSHFGTGILLPERCVCTYYACDNNGSGTKEREDYTYLIFKI
ncbi:MAG: hypothetical protein LUG91_10760 [Ruminococcus sp.]|nr:hypothetical protein [Ruminococcus sp.]